MFYPVQLEDAAEGNQMINTHASRLCHYIHILSIYTTLFTSKSTLPCVRILCSPYPCQIRKLCVINVVVVVMKRVHESFQCIRRISAVWIDPKVYG